MAEGVDHRVTAERPAKFGPALVRRAQPQIRKSGGTSTVGPRHSLSRLGALVDASYSKMARCVSPGSIIPEG